MIRPDLSAILEEMGVEQPALQQPPTGMVRADVTSVGWSARREVTVVNRHDEPASGQALGDLDQAAREYAAFIEPVATAKPKPDPRCPTCRQPAKGGLCRACTRGGKRRMGHGHR